MYIFSEVLKSYLDEQLERGGQTINTFIEGNDISKN